MNTIDLTPFNKLTEKLSNSTPTTFESLKDELSQRDENGVPVYFVGLKEDNDLCLLYYNDYGYPSDLHTGFQTEVEESCRNLIIEKSTLNPVCTQLSKIVYNEDALTYLQDKNWSDISVYKCYEGTLMMVFGMVINGMYLPDVA